jgi:hypothetical protein
MLGNISDAESLNDEALQRARAIEFAEEEAALLFLAAEIKSERGVIDDAFSHLIEGLEIAQNGGMELFLCDGHLLKSKLEQIRDRHAEAVRDAQLSFEFAISDKPHSTGYFSGRKKALAQLSDLNVPINFDIDQTGQHYVPSVSIDEINLVDEFQVKSS